MERKMMHQSEQNITKKNTIYEACKGSYRSIRKAIEKQSYQEVYEKFDYKIITLNKMLSEHQKMSIDDNQIQQLFSMILSNYDFLNSVDLDVINEMIILGQFTHKIYQLSPSDYIKCVHEYSQMRSKIIEKEAEKIVEKMRKEKENSSEKMSLSEYLSSNPDAASKIKMNLKK